MNLFVRSLQSSIVSAVRPKLSSFETPCRHSFRVLPTDIDVFRHMNNARYLNYLEAARWGSMVQTRFLPIMMKKRWIAPISTLKIEFFRPLKLFDKFEITTQFVRFEEKWCFILQRIWTDEKEMARALVKVTIRDGRRNVPPEEYLGALQSAALEPELPKDVSGWLEHEFRSFEAS